LVWGCSIGRRLLLLCAAIPLAAGITGCGSLQQANANVAFMGDSITQAWWLPKSNLGISGNTSAQMLARFPSEVPGHAYKAVVILAGTNDVRTSRKPIGETVETAIANIDQMAAMADAESLDVVMCLIPPLSGEDAGVEALNEAIAGEAQEHGYKLVDYYTPMVNHPEYFRDGVHPNDDGYFVMQKALTAVISLDY
jgi:lysophospholipase L1-like esterase